MYSIRILAKHSDFFLVFELLTLLSWVVYDTSAGLLCSSNRACASMVLYYKHLFPSFKLVISR